MAQIEKPTEKGAGVQEKPETAGKHLISFAGMIVLTVIAFALVGTGAVSNGVVIPVILLLAAIQVVIQLFTFMHLDQKGSFFPILFMGGGFIVAATAIIAMLFWV
ncbi:cytochrome C oxidase subunit IV family protein [Paludifilum halophilum]|uniref:Cytochrome C oxidase subunit IV n=1 Tax=Paludifilum halophilum TaxID=1642702 RepID=A0A235B562_9BACL|nr:cytochrome C oxidase subunit IV family protein [Paludifilum halophilum]OYD07371.1 hypothetical protein CHM34_10700 [Paludifilum halophilum]